MKKDIMDCKRALKMTYKLINEILNGDESLKEEMSAEDEDAYDNHPAYMTNAQRGLWQ